MDVFACFELNGVDAPVLKAIKTFSPALAWRDKNYFERFIMPFAVDKDPVEFPPEDLFEWAARNEREQAS